MDKREVDIASMLWKLGTDITNGYGPKQIPDPIDSDVELLVNTVGKLPKERLETVAGNMSLRHSQVLLAFAERMATLAVRCHDRKPLVAGLLAIRLAQTSSYMKEVMPILSVILDAAARLNISSTELVQEPSIDGSFRSFLSEFEKRPPETRNIDAMGYKLEDVEGGPRYLRIW